jgi:hypothetical protein
MRRYHIKVYTDKKHYQILSDFTDNLNRLKWGYTDHCIDNIKTRTIDLVGLLRYIKDIKLEVSQIFEYCLKDYEDRPEKICCRLPYTQGADIILVIGEDKKIITIWINSKTDNHKTLKKELYITV